MVRRLVLSLALLCHFTAPARAADMSAEVYGVAEFPNPGGPKTDLITFGSALPGGGRAFDFGQFGQGGALCTAYTGQSDWFCASASARVEVDRQLVETTTYIGTSTVVRLKAQIHLDYRNASATSAEMWAKASITIPLACNAAEMAPVNGLNVLFRLDGDYSVSASDPDVMVKAPRPFETCTPGGVCTINVPTFHCPEGDSTTSLTFDLWPIVQIENLAGHSGWSVQAVSDFSHTFTLEGIDALDDQGHPLADVRLVVPGDGGALNEVFLTGEEAAEVDASSTTTTTTTINAATTTTLGATTTTTIGPTTTTAIGATTTTSTSSTTSTTAPACATADLAAAGCRCAVRPAGCEGVTLSRPLEKGVKGLCAKIAKATAASGKKQRRLAKQAGALARKTLRTVNGRKGNSIPDACREELRGFLQATQTDAATATH